MGKNFSRWHTAGSIWIVLLLAACSPATATVIPANTPPPVSTTSPTMDPRTPLIMDTDMSIDGIMAILYMLQQPEFRFEAITVTGNGEAHCEPGTTHALGLIAMTESGDIPVACGREKSLKANHQFPDFIRDRVDGSLGITWPEGGEVSNLSAPELIQSILTNAVQPVVVVTDGPLTNLAEVFLAAPGLAKKIKMIYIMGGAVDVPGNLFNIPQYSKEVTAEFNIFIDPYAAGVVINSGAPITLVPLDITNQVPLDRVFYNILAKNQETTAARAVYDMLTSTAIYKEGLSFWDPLTYAIASDESLATFETKKITVIEKGQETGRTKVTADGQEVRVAVSTDADEFIQTYLSGLNGGKEVAIDWVSARATPTAPPNTLIVTIAGGKCSLEGSMQVDAEALGVLLKNQDPEKWAGLVVATIDRDKTFADLEKWPSTDQPPWLEVVEFTEVLAGKESLVIVPFAESPFFLVCFDSPPGMKIGVFGPIERK